MVIIHEGGHSYRLRLRAAYSHIRSEKAFREMLRRSIDGFRENGGVWIKYAEDLDRKSIWEVCSVLGILTTKEKIS